MACLLIVSKLFHFSDDLFCVGRGAIVQKKEEFIAAPAAEDICSACKRLDGGYERADHDIPFVVSVSVIHF